MVNPDKLTPTNNNTPVSRSDDADTDTDMGIKKPKGKPSTTKVFKKILDESDEESTFEDRMMKKKAQDPDGFIGNLSDQSLSSPMSLYQQANVKKKMATPLMETTPLEEAEGEDVEAEAWVRLR